MSLCEGDAVRLQYGDEWMPATILKASANEKSLLLVFDGIIGKHAGAMPVLMDEITGVYRSIIDRTEVFILKM